LFRYPSPSYRFELVYWADLLHPEPLNPLITDKNHPLFLDEPYVPAIKTEVPKSKKVRQKVLQYLEKVLDKVILNEDFSINYKTIADSIIEDKIAINYNLSDDYQENIFQVRAIDIIVSNNYEFRGVKNHHKVYGYLRAQECAEIIDTFLSEATTDWIFLVQVKLGVVFRWVNRIIRDSLRSFRRKDRN